ncbi:MAG TPA: class I SAM-dependent methyltransferase [Terriglobales bacterium]|jgi:ubiquinone/menaquinone biosynthesis C-methylase UbiE
MNRIHRWLCRSAKWDCEVKENVLPWALNGVELGQNVLEVGPGPGLTTDVLRAKVERLTAIEIDPALAQSLRHRMQSSNVEVVEGDATAMPFQNAQFSAAVSFTMLHHVPSPNLQDKLLRDVHRVLKPGGIFLGVDSLQSFAMRILHIGDTLVPIDPERFPARLESAGFKDIVVETGARRFRFQARKPD